MDDLFLGLASAGHGNNGRTRTAPVGADDGGAAFGLAFLGARSDGKGRDMPDQPLALPAVRAATGAGQQGVVASAIFPPDPPSGSSDPTTEIDAEPASAQPVGASVAPGILLPRQGDALWLGQGDVVGPGQGDVIGPGQQDNLGPPILPDWTSDMPVPWGEGGTESGPQILPGLVIDAATAGPNTLVRAVGQSNNADAPLSVAQVDPVADMVPTPPGVGSLPLPFPAVLTPGSANERAVAPLRSAIGSTAAPLKRPDAVPDQPLVLPAWHEAAVVAGSRAAAATMPQAATGTQGVPPNGPIVADIARPTEPRGGTGASPPLTIASHPQTAPGPMGGGSTNADGITARPGTPQPLPPLSPLPSTSDEGRSRSLAHPIAQLGSGSAEPAVLPHDAASDTRPGGSVSRRDAPVATNMAVDPPIAMPDPIAEAENVMRDAPSPRSPAAPDVPRTGAQSWSVPTAAMQSLAMAQPTARPVAVPAAWDVPTDVISGADLGLAVTALSQSGLAPGIAPGAAVPAHMPSPMAHAAAQQIAAALADPARAPDAPLELALDPPELGRVRLQITELAGIMTLTIHAERPETADLMRRHLDLLAQEFAQSGLDAPSVRISQDGAGGGNGAAGDRDGSRPLSTAPPEAEAPPLVQRRTADGALDLRL